MLGCVCWGCVCPGSAADVWLVFAAEVGRSFVSLCVVAVLHCTSCLAACLLAAAGSVQAVTGVCCVLHVCCSSVSSQHDEVVAIAC